MKKPKQIWRSLGLALACVVLAPADVWAQAESTPASVGLGGHVGDPSGLVMRIHPRLGQAVDIIAALDRERYRYVAVHVLAERFIPDSPLQLYAGPGLMTGSVAERGELRYALGGSLMVGAQFYRGRLGVFLHVLPQLRVLPKHQFNGAAGVGFRYYPRWR
ncbi:MAG: hypothetical protein RhofKO_05250 [Rhodothermales bacterium]